MPIAADVTSYSNFIDGEWCRSSVRRDLREPQSRQHRRPHRRVPEVEAADVEAALEAATRAYERWRLVPAPMRAEILFSAAQLIVERKEEFARDMTREMGKVLNETRGDVQEAIDMTFYMAGEGRRMFGQTVPSELRNKFAMSVRQPLGVCSIITPWNFPMAIPSWKIIPGARLRQHRRLQAGVADAAVGAQLRQGPRGGRHARRASSTWSPATATRSARR